MDQEDPSEILSQESIDSAETVRDWFLKTQPDWQFQDHSGEYPRNWQIVKPNSNLGVIIMLAPPSPITIKYKCW